MSLELCRVSAIVVARNGEPFLAQALSSIMQQSRRPDEVIVVDGQSTDRTAEIARSFAGVRYILQSNLGLANARNLGIEAARGDWIAFLDHDDMWTPDKLEFQIDYLSAHPEYVYATAWVRLFLEPGCALRPGFQPETFKTGQPANTPGTLLAPRHLFEQVGLFDPALHIACEVDWFARAQDAGIPSATIPRVLLHKRIHQGNISADIMTFRREWLTVIQRSLARKKQEETTV